MEDQFIEYLAEPSRDRFLRLRQGVVDDSDFVPYSDDLDEISGLIQNKMFQEALDRVWRSMPNRLLSPRAHMLASVAYGELGKEEECKREKCIYQACISGILSTGDGSKERPYLVTSVSDEHDVLFALEKEFVRQALSNEEGGRRYDVFDLTNGTQLYFDITDCFGKIHEMLFGRSGRGKQKRWWQFWK